MNSEIPPYLMDSLLRAEQAKQAVLDYPYYTDETRNAWLDAIDGSLDVQVNAHRRAMKILEEILKKEFKKKKDKNV